MTELSKLYDARFTSTGLDKRDKVWKVLCASYFQKLVPEDAVLLDLACGYGEFINNMRAVLNGFEVERVVPRFLPYTMNNATPTHELLVRAYLAMPLAWKMLGKQFLVIAREPQ